MSESVPIRYQIDFHLIPSLFHHDKYRFSEVFAEAADEFLAYVYNRADIASKQEVFVHSLKYDAKSHFTVYQKDHPGGIRIIYVTLPPVDDGSHVYCTAYALVLVKGEPNFYTIEESVFGTTCIGTVDQEENHINMGDAGKSVEENMEILYSFFANVNGKPAIETNETVHPDGSRTVTILDNRTNKGEIHEYDPKGNLIRTTYGTFSDEPEISDDDFDDFLTYLKEGKEATAQKAEGHLKKGCAFLREKDYKNALNCFMRAGELGNAEAYDRAGLLYLEGEGTPVDFDMARFCFKEAIDGGSATAIKHLQRLKRAEANRESTKGLRLTPESIAARHGVSVDDVRIGETPEGGVYSIITRGGKYVSITEYDGNHNEIYRTTGYVGK